MRIIWTRASRTLLHRRRAETVCAAYIATRDGPDFPILSKVA